MVFYQVESPLNAFSHAKSRKRMRVASYPCCIVPEDQSIGQSSRRRPLV